LLTGNDFVLTSSTILSRIQLTAFDVIEETGLCGELDDAETLLLDDSGLGHDVDKFSGASQYISSPSSDLTTFCLFNWGSTDAVAASSSKLSLFDERLEDADENKMLSILYEHFVDFLTDFVIFFFKKIN